MLGLLFFGTVSVQAQALSCPTPVANRQDAGAAAGDIGYPIYSTSAADCQQICTKDPTCKAFAWASPSYSYYPNHCFKKAKVTPLVYTAGSTVGLPCTRVTADRAFVSIKPGNSCNSPEHGRAPITTLAECQNAFNAIKPQLTLTPTNNAVAQLGLANAPAGCVLYNEDAPPGQKGSIFWNSGSNCGSLTCDPIYSPVCSRSATATCHDTPNWLNGVNKLSCGDYQLQVNSAGQRISGFCDNGGVVPGQEFALGAQFNFPEQNCCSCGKPAGNNVVPPSPTPAPTPDPTPAPACHDTPNWQNQYHFACADFQHNDIPSLGTLCVLGQGPTARGFAFIGPTYGSPELNCCACGRGGNSKVSPVASTLEAPQAALEKAAPLKQAMGPMPVE